MCKTINNLILVTTLLLSACSTEIKFESSEVVKNPHWSDRYYAFYLVSNYDESKYPKVSQLASDEFIRITQTNDSLEYIQFDFYKKNWNTSIFLTSWDPYGSNSLMLPENDKKYGKYHIDGTYYKRIGKSNKWLHDSWEMEVADTIVVKSNK